jgi:hypothetical protein
MRWARYATQSKGSSLIIYTKTSDNSSIYNSHFPSKVENGLQLKN